MKNKNAKVIPKFKNEDEERAFWATADVTEYFDVEHPYEQVFQITCITGLDHCDYGI